MTREERIEKLRHLITCMKCEVSGKSCDDNCPTQYDAGNMGEIIENLEEIAKALEQEPCEDCISRQAALDAFGLSEKSRKYGGDHSGYDTIMLYEVQDALEALPSVQPQPKMSSSENPNKWIPVSERLPETDNENSINNYNVLLWVKNKSHPEREPQIYLGKLRHIDGDDGSGNFWGVEIKPCDWTICGWCYFNEPEVVAWMPLPEPYRAESEGK